jgi:hypothetical protein
MTRSCAINLQVKSKYYERSRNFSTVNYTTSQPKLKQETNAVQSSISYVFYAFELLSSMVNQLLSSAVTAIINIVFLIIISMLVVERQYAIFKSIADISLQCFYAYIDARSLDSAYRLINTVKNEAIALVIRSSMLSIGLSVIVSAMSGLNETNFISALANIFIGIFIMTRDKQLLIMLDISPQEISAIDGGRYARQESMQKYMTRYEKTANLVNKLNPYKIFRKK